MRCPVRQKFNKARHGDVYCIAASPPFRSRACWLALCNQTNGEPPMKKVILAISAVVVFSGVAQAEDYLHGQSGTTYQNIGNTTYGSNGSTSQQIGNTTYGRNGSTSQRIGNTTYSSDGSTSQQIGNTLYNSDGSTVQRIGNTTYGSDGTTCQKIGNQTYCN